MKVVTFFCFATVYTAEQEMLETRMSVIKHKLLVVSGKGGSYFEEFDLLIVRSWEVFGGLATGFDLTKARKKGRGSICIDVDCLTDRLVYWT